MPSVPSSLSLETIVDGSDIIASQHRNNYTAVQAAVNGIITLLADVASKGDLLAATGNDALARLAVGADGQFLKANSGTSTGLEWGAGVLPSLVTALPGAPANGDECILVDSVSAPTYAWHLKYVSAATTYKWYCIGGTPAKTEVQAAQTTASGAYTDLATNGPDFTVPVAGDYDITIGALLHGGGSGNDFYMSFAVGGTAASDNDAILGGPYRSTGMVERRKTGIAAATLLRAKYKTGGGVTGTFQNRWMSVIPFRVG